MSAQVAHELKAELAGKAAPPDPGMASQQFSHTMPPRNMSMERGASAIPPPGRRLDSSSAFATAGTMPVPVAQGSMVMGQPAAQPFIVQVPYGMGPGQAMMVQSPTTGQMLQVTVPPNVGPGGQFQVIG